MNSTKQNQNTLEISWNELEKLTEELVKKIKDKNFNSILCISSGGLVLGKLVSDYLDLELAVIATKGYDKGKKYRTTEEIKIGNIATINPIQGNILVVDDLIDSGATMNKIYNSLKDNKDVRRLETAVLFIKPWSRFIPDYYVEKTDCWIIFPYERNEFLRQK